MRYSQQRALIAPPGAKHGPSAIVSRRAYVRSLAMLDAVRAQAVSHPSQIAGVTSGAQLTDVAPTTTYAKAVALGWIAPIDGKFAGSKPLTGDEAARGIVGALGLQASTENFAARLRAELPGAPTDYYLRAAHVYTRVLNMRYNLPAGKERWEVGPSEPMYLAHVAYMLHKAATAEGWRLESLTAYEQFDLPGLGPNQARVLRSGVEMLGQPYVWAGETEGQQSEGHGGFDCSGFVWRTLLYGGVTESDRSPLPERTSMAMSAAVKGGLRLRGMESLQPADLMFWGDRGPKSSPSENFHAGVYMGNGWFIHSSGGNGGPNIDRLDGWWGERFSWGRRVLLRP